MKNLLILAFVCLVACNKSVDIQSTPQKTEKPQSCNFGITQFNYVKRTITDEEISRGKPIKSSTTGSVTTPSGGSVIFLDFDGCAVSGTAWNYNGDINCGPANLKKKGMDEIVNRVRNDIIQLNITVKTNHLFYNAANQIKKRKVLIKETFNGLGRVVAFLLLVHLPGVIIHPALYFLYC